MPHPFKSGIFYILTLTIIYFIFTNAFNQRKENTIFYTRQIILAILAMSYITYYTIDFTSLGKGIALYGGIFNLSSITQSFNIFILLISGTILIYNGFNYTSNIKVVKYYRTGIGDIFRSLSDIIDHMLKGIVYILYLNKINDEYSSYDSYYSYKIYKEKDEDKALEDKMQKLINPRYKRKPETKLNVYLIAEYPVIILFIITGAVFLMTSGDLISIFISIELQSYGLYILSTINKDSEKATWAGLTYFLLGGLSSCFILLGSALLYINSGTTNLEGIYIITSISEALLGSLNDIDRSLLINPNDIIQNLSWYNTYYINISLLILSVGFLFKVSAAPFHFWSPDVYDALPTTVTTYVAIIAKISIFVLLMELVYYLGEKSFLLDNTKFMDLSINYNFSWKNCLLLSSVASLIIGSVLGLTQNRIKRLYAYSTISHVGFILLALSVDNIESVNAYIFYIISYTVSNLNAFIILVGIGYHMTWYNNLIIKYCNSVYLYDMVWDKINGIKNERETIPYVNKSYLNHSPISKVINLKSYFYKNSYLCLSLTITLFSFIGIPPLIGFFAKQKVLSAALDNGYVFITLLAIITSVIAAVYYLQIIKQMFFYPINDKREIFTLALENNKIYISSQLSFIISLLTGIILVFIFIPNESFNIANIFSLTLYN